MTNLTFYNFIVHRNPSPGHKYLIKTTITPRLVAATL